jgi:uncharacterized protein YecT (DUF1311 family)
MMLAFLLITAAVPQTDAEVEKRYSTAFDTCMAGGEAANGVTFAMVECGNAELERQDARLNQAYKMVMDRLPRKRKTTLRTSQRAWIRERNAECQRAYDAAGGGTASGLEKLGCLTSETIKRTIFLERYR